MKIFKDIVEGDKLYVFSNPHKALHTLDPIIELEDLEKDNAEKIVVTIFVKNNTYPAKRERYVNYMHMNGDEPTGVGTSVSYVDDNYNTDIEVVDHTGKERQLKLSADKSVCEHCGNIYFTDIASAKEYAINYYTNLIDSLSEQSHNINERINSLVKLKGLAEAQ